MLVTHSQAQKCLNINSNPTTKLIWNFKDFLFNSIFYLLTGWLTDFLTYWLMPSEKHNSILAKATGLISSLFNVALSQGMSFCQLQQFRCLHHGSAKGYLCSPLCSIPFSTIYGWRFAVCALWLQCETWMSAGALLALFFAWNVIQSVWTSWKWSIVIHHDQVTHPLFISNWAALWWTNSL